MTRASLSAPPPRKEGGCEGYLARAVERWMMPVVALLLLFAVAVARGIAMNWPLVHDAVLIHYVVFLMDHGKAPYRDIVEMNMPGTYMTQWLAVHLFGGDATGWRRWDLLLGSIAVGASSWIAGPGRRSAGVAAGCLAYLDHLADGAEHLGQRDWLVAVLLLVAFGCMFEAIRKQLPVWMAGFMACCGLAISIKPPVILFAVGFLFATAWLEWRKAGSGQIPSVRSYGRYLVWSVAGGLLPVLAVATFLGDWGVTRQFLTTVHDLVPYYASAQGFHYLGIFKKAEVLRPLAIGSLLVFLFGQSWRRWEPAFLAAAVLVGTILFVAQGKGFVYHLYPEVVFLSLWGMLELNRGLHGGKGERAVAIATLLLTALWTAPRLLHFMRANHYPLETISHLQGDLDSLGGPQLSGRVQCLDMTMGGCITVLYRMKLVQSTGFIYDFYLLPKQANPLVETLRERFLQEITARPPSVMVLSSQEWPSERKGYDQLGNWPALEDVLQKDYTMYKELPEQPRSAGYRVYALKKEIAR